MHEGAEVALWEGQPVAHWAREWNLPRLKIFASATSTNDVVRRFAEDGAPDGTTAIADEQTAGRGRLGRSWTAPPRRALLMSTLLRPAQAAHGGSISIGPLRIGIAVAESIEELVGLHLLLKWPNDVIDPAGEKVAGILCEAALGQNGSGFIVAGIGINVNQTAADWPAPLAGQATSLAILAGRPISRALLAAAILGRIRGFARHAHQPLSRAELHEYARRDYLRGRRILLDGRSAGTAAGISPDGGLLIDTHDRRQVVHAGTVRLDEVRGNRRSDAPVAAAVENAARLDSTGVRASIPDRPHRTR